MGFVNSILQNFDNLIWINGNNAVFIESESNSSSSSTSNSSQSFDEISTSTSSLFYSSSTSGIHYQSSTSSETSETSETSVTSETSSDKRKLALQYRFSGYNLPMLQLDSTGPQYIYIHPHPYYYNQPAYWGKGIHFETNNIRSKSTRKLYPLSPYPVNTKKKR